MWSYLWWATPHTCLICYGINDICWREAPVSNVWFWNATFLTSRLSVFCTRKRMPACIWEFVLCGRLCPILNGLLMSIHIKLLSLRFCRCYDWVGWLKEISLIDIPRLYSWQGTTIGLRLLPWILLDSPLTQSQLDWNVANFHSI